MTDLCLIVSMLYISHEIISLSLRLCSTLQIQSKMDSAYLLESLAGNFMDVVQYNEDNRAFEVCERVHIVDHKHENDNQNKTVPVHEDSTKGITRVKESEKLKSKT